MSKEQQAAKGAPREGAKKVPAKSPSTGKPAGSSEQRPAEQPKPIKKAPSTATDTPSEKVAIDGKVVRKDKPATSTRPVLQQETLSSSSAPKEQTRRPSMSKPASTIVGDGSPSQSGSEKAASILGEYKLLKKIGQGGMGAVYKAQKIGSERIVAVKVLSKELSSKPAYVERFKREARVMEKLDHPNILRLLDVGQHKNYYFLAMELVEGGSVEGWLKKMGRFSIGDALHIVLKTAEGLQHAHEQSLIHRDIKPDNILLARDGTVKIADLGLAKDTEEDNSLTKTGAGAGTPLYMAPEQARDVKHVDARVDIYALGVMMYVFLTGQPPFQGTTLVEVIAAKEKGKFDPIRKHNDEVPPKLDLIVDKMIARDPKHRFASCAEVIAALTPFGLANEQLSFFGAGQAVTVEGAQGEKSTTPSKGPKPQSTQMASKPGATTRGPSVAAAKTNIQEREPVEKDIWYWHMKTPQGKVVVKKLTTEQVRMLIKSGSIDAEAEISKTPKSGFRSIATFDEFQAMFRAQKTTTRTKAKGNKYEDLYKEMEQAAEEKKRWAKITRMFSGAAGALFGLFWILMILVALGLGIWYVISLTL